LSKKELISRLTLTPKAATIEINKLDADDKKLHVS